METFSASLHLCGIPRSPVDFPRKGQWRGALMFSLIHSWRHGSANSRDAGDLRPHGAYYDVTVMLFNITWAVIHQPYLLVKMFSAQRHNGQILWFHSIPMEKEMQESWTIFHKFPRRWKPTSDCPGTNIYPGLFRENTCCGLYWYRPVSQIPQYTSLISHNAPSCNRNLHMCAHFCHKMVHWGIFVKWIMGLWVGSIDMGCLSLFTCGWVNTQETYVLTFYYILVSNC